MGAPVEVSEKLTTSGEFPDVGAAVKPAFIIAPFAYFRFQFEVS
jgi:hypothetical protein